MSILTKFYIFVLSLYAVAFIAGPSYAGWLVYVVVFWNAPEVIQRLADCLKPSESLSVFSRPSLDPEVLSVEKERELAGQ